MNLFKPQKISLARREAWAGYAFIIPWIIGFLVFTIGPMLSSLYFSFTDYNIVDPPRWVGLDNYARIFSGIPEYFRTGDPRQLGDPLFWKSLQVTLYFASIALPQSCLQFFPGSPAQSKGSWRQRLADHLLPAIHHFRRGRDPALDPYPQSAHGHSEPIFAECTWC